MKNPEPQTDIILERMIKTHENRVAEISKRKPYYEKRAAEKGKRYNELLKLIHVDPKEMERMQEEDNKAIRVHLEEIRPELINRESRQLEDSRNRALFLELSKKPNQILTTAVTSLYTASDNETLKDIHGAVGNGWILPDDPTVGSIAVGDFGGGSGKCGAGALVVSSDDILPPSATFLFKFTPLISGTWTVTPVIAFHGFYVLRADDTILTCKSAFIRLEVEVRIFQLTPFIKKFTLLDKGDDNIDEFGLYDSTEFLEMPVLLKEDNEVTVAVTARIYAEAHGAGSYAELNFHNGVGNQIIPIVLIATPA